MNLPRLLHYNCLGYTWDILGLPAKTEHRNGAHRSNLQAHENTIHPPSGLGGLGFKLHPPADPCLAGYLREAPAVFSQLRLRREESLEIRSTCLAGLLGVRRDIEQSRKNSCRPL